jgi:hypothetical protein
MCDSNGGLAISAEKDTIRSIHRAIAKWQKHSGRIVGIYFPKTRPLSYASFVRVSNEVVSGFVVRAKVV